MRVAVRPRRGKLRHCANRWSVTHTQAQATQFVIVTGLSGAGKSQAAKCLEDLGYFCVDNLPPSLIPKFAELCNSSRSLRKVALVLDIRGEEIFGDLVEQLRVLDRERFPYRVVFLDAGDDVLVR